MREYFDCDYWWSVHPGAKALLVIRPWGGVVMVKRGWTLTGRMALAGIIE